MLYHEIRNDNNLETSSASSCPCSWVCSRLHEGDRSCSRSRPKVIILNDTIDCPSRFNKTSISSTHPPSSSSVSSIALSRLRQFLANLEAPIMPSEDWSKLSIGSSLYSIRRVYQRVENELDGCPLAEWSILARMAAVKLTGILICSSIWSTPLNTISISFELNFSSQSFLLRTSKHRSATMCVLGCIVESGNFDRCRNGSEDGVRRI